MRAPSSERHGGDRAGNSRHLSALTATPRPAAAPRSAKPPSGERARGAANAEFEKRPIELGRASPGLGGTFLRRLLDGVTRSGKAPCPRELRAARPEARREPAKRPADSTTRPGAARPALTISERPSRQAFWKRACLSSWGRSLKPVYLICGNRAQSEPRR